jgi:hypothetical protein
MPVEIIYLFIFAKLNITRQALYHLATSLASERVNLNRNEAQINSQACLIQK